MQIKTKTHFDASKQQAQKQVDDANNHRSKLRSDLTDLEYDRTTQLRDRQNHMALLAENLRMGLESTKAILEPKIKELDVSIEKLDSEIKEINKSILEVKTPTPPSFEREDLFVSVLVDKLGCEEAEAVEKLEDCFLGFEVVRITVDGFGRPTSCLVVFSSNLKKEFTIKPSGNHYWKGFRPKELEWLPTDFMGDKTADTQWSKENLERNTFRRNGSKDFSDTKYQPLYDKTSGSFILPVTIEKVGYDAYGRIIEKRTSHADTFPEFAVSLGSVLDSLIEPAKDGLDLNDSYSAHPLLAGVCEAIIAQTSPHPLSNPSSECLASPDIFKKIKADWDGFTTCPWSGDVTGTLALLKHHVENGETVRFWSNGFEDYYGFRMRTRDHNWVRGNIFIAKSIPAAKSGTPLTLHRKDNWGRYAKVVSHSRMFIFCDLIDD